MLREQPGSLGEAASPSEQYHALGRWDFPPEASRLCEYWGEERWRLWNGWTPGDDKKGMSSKFPSNATKTPQWQGTGEKACSEGRSPHCQWTLLWAPLRRCLCEREKPWLILKWQKRNWRDKTKTRGLVYSSLPSWCINFPHYLHRTLEDSLFPGDVQTYSVELDRGLNLLPLIFFLLPPTLPEKKRKKKIVYS